MKEINEKELESQKRLHSYYAAWESRLGYRLLLGGNRHFGYYRPGTIWPFPLGAAMSKSEDDLYDLLNLPADSRVLDAGCGNGFVALHFACNGLFVEGIDVTERHIRRAEKNIRAQKMEHRVTTRVADYHDLYWIPKNSLDGVYTMETFVHARDPQKVLDEFFEVLKPGGTIAMHEYWHLTPDELQDRNVSPDIVAAALRVNKYGAMPAYKLLTPGVLKQWLKNRGFIDIEEVDLSENIGPMLLFFYVLSFVPYLVICFFGLQARFVNTEAAAQGYRGLRKGFWGKASYKARKPPLGYVDKFSNDET